MADLATGQSSNFSNATPKYRTGNEYQYRAAVGGFIPGYKGHRPGSRKLVGETSYGGVPRDLERTGMRPGAGMGFGPRNTTSNMELGNNYRGRHPEREEAFLAFAPRATKINAMIQGQDLQSSSMGAMQQEYLRRAAEMQKKRTPFEQRGGWPTPHGQPWDDRELQQRNPGVKPWMTFVEKEMADIRAQRGNRDEDDAPIWW